MARIQICYDGLKHESCLIQTGIGRAFHNVLLMFSLRECPLAIWKTWKCWVFWMTNIVTDPEGKNKCHLSTHPKTHRHTHTQTTLVAVTKKTDRLFFWECLRQKKERKHILHYREKLAIMRSHHLRLRDKSVSLPVLLSPVTATYIMYKILKS